jgi:hypothetical protein
LEIENCRIKSKKLNFLNVITAIYMYLSSTRFREERLLCSAAAAAAAGVTTFSAAACGGDGGECNAAQSLATAMHSGKQEYNRDYCKALMEKTH